ncbi:PREDICTED: olfactory receptor 5V1-like [Nanorana parkeri]|uniref:olfactory receptor 5V1-like n=1 Tax=Nanorana parkeri TaxID=125878 RepID=UPI000854ACEE|nr:PREDICTED: olfactory receptor 5V1-like [Nanorana parkeri]
MLKSNTSIILEVIILGFPEMSEKRLLLFMLLFHIYVMASSGNLLIMIVTKLDSSLQSPMYFFLGHLSMIDICYISATVPLMLVILISHHNHLQFSACVVQLHTVIFLEGAECFLLAIMAYDRYAAICRPLHYTFIMKRGVCYKLLCGGILCSLLNSMIHTTLIIRLPFCDNEINHMFCDIPPLLKLSCIDTYLNEVILFAVSAVFVGLGPLVFILISYFYIVVTILKNTSNVGRQKMFSTCVSHLIIVTMFYGTGCFNYVRPRSSYSMERDKLVSVIYNVATPFLNPIVYSLRNNEVKRALINGCRKHFFHKGRL